MKAFWSRIARELSPYVPGEQPRIANLVKLNTNESPFGPSPLALEAMRAAAVDTLRLYPDLFDLRLPAFDAFFQALNCRKPRTTSSSITRS